ncbi:MAG: hypothetical protein DWQ35_17980 [Planctomycetota bacterium]|nr:MAG: hypothetical protein DWQ35_17980 [Planctomycetota bacterium]REK31440.1 MAG: hypothetical protein DWQ42_00490 [Planctomycetota bacterium]REK40670.1 MAG: hypothetical protein DWQ46_15630 [Planctomycetota bacterium]
MLARPFDWPFAPNSANCGAFSRDLDGPAAASLSFAASLPGHASGGQPATRPLPPRAATASATARMSPISTTAVAYRCPGETQEISRAIHLGRLASHYAGCLRCPHRNDAGTLSGRQLAQLTNWSERRREQLAFAGHTIRGGYRDHLGPSEVRRLAGAFGTWLFGRHESDSSRSRVAVGSDGVVTTAEVHAAATEGLRFSGCDVLDVGFVTAPTLVHAISNRSLDGGLLLNFLSQPLPQLELRMFGGGAMPLSAGGELDEVRQRFEASSLRAKRTAGSLRRQAVTDAYLDQLRPVFHALRPLRFVLKTASRPLRSSVQELIKQVACRAIDVEESNEASARRSERDDTELSERVVALGADFGIWVDAAGEAVHVVDELGQGILPHAMLPLLIWERTTAAEPDAQDVHQDATRPRFQAEEELDPTAAEMYISLLSNRADAAVQRGGRYWFTREVPVVDGLEVLARLLGRLSQSDRPLSAVLADDETSR